VQLASLNGENYIEIYVKTSKILNNHHYVVLIPE